MTSTQALPLTRRPSSPVSSSSSSPSSRASGHVETYPYPVTSRQTRPPEARWRRPIGIYWHILAYIGTPALRRSANAPPAPSRARGSLQPRPTDRHLPAAPGTRAPFSAQARASPSRRTRSKPSSKVCLDQELHPSNNPDPNPNPQPQPEPTAPTPNPNPNPNQAS
mgnify:CR=1 FL=1